MEKILLKLNTLPKTDKEGCIKFLSKEEVSKAKKFHESFLEYDKTPLVELDNLEEIRELKDIESEYINKALDLYGRDTAGKKKAAKKLGIGIATLYRKIGEQ